MKLMGRILKGLGALIILLSFGLNAYFYTVIERQKLVVEVVDGDTFQLYSGKRVRLLGVDSPELQRCGGRQAKEKLAGLILGKKVTLKEEVSEAFGRSLALVYVDGQFVNRIILESGWGRTDYRKNSKREELTAAFHLAQRGKLGIWSNLCREEEGYPPQDECVIKGNIDKNTYEKFYHLPSCLHYREIVIEKDIGERYFCSEQEVLEAGFKKAAGCP